MKGEYDIKDISLIKMNKKFSKNVIDLKRFCSAILGFPLVALIFIFGNKYVVDVGMCLIAIIAMYEYLQAVSAKCNPVKGLSFLCCIPIAFIHLIPAQYMSTISFIALPSILLILFLKIVVTGMKTNFNDIVYTFLGIIYISFFSLCIALVRGLNNGKILIWYIMFIGWGTDVFAYLIGKTFGKHKFSSVSPKKSIEGCVGGTLGAVVTSLIFTYCINTFMALNYSYMYIIIISIILSLIGQLGDFAASTIKRYVGIKDFSNLIPGHGGMLDRIDSLLFIAPFAYILLSII